MTQAKQFCEALEAVASEAPEKSREIERRFAPVKERVRDRLYFTFADGSQAFFDARAGVISLVRGV